MRQPVTSLLLAGLLLGSMLAPATAAEREQVRIVVNLMAAVKMPYPENLARNRARTQRVWLEYNGAATVACLRLEPRRWCYEHIAPVGARAEMPLIGNVIQFFHRATNRGPQFRDEYQKMYDEGIQIALKYLGE